MKDPNQYENILDEVNKNRRSFLRTVLGGSFAAPLIASFSVGTLLTSSANAAYTSTFDNQPYLDMFFLESGR